MIGGPDDPFRFHAFHDRCGPVVADLQAALDVARRGLAIAQHNLDRLTVEIAGTILRPHRGCVEYRAVFALLLAARRDGVEVLRCALRLEVMYDPLDFSVGDE